MDYHKLLEDCDFIKVKQTVEIRPHDGNKGFLNMLIIFLKV